MTTPLRRLLLSSAAALLFLSACDGNIAEHGELDADGLGTEPGAIAETFDPDKTGDFGGEPALPETDAPTELGPSSPAMEEPIAPAVPRVDGLLWRATATDRQLEAFGRTEVNLNPDGTLTIAAGMSGKDPYGPGQYSGGNYYNGGTYRYGIATSPVKVVQGGFDRAIPSFAVDTPPGTWVTLKLAARVGGRWTKDYVLGIWAADYSAVRRHSVNGQGDGDGNVNTDTLELKGTADAFRYTVVLLSENNASPVVREVAVAAKRAAVDGPAPAGDRSVWGTTLNTPAMSQMIYTGGNVWCSPTSVTMILRYWSDKLGIPNLAQDVPTAAKTGNMDWIYGGTGNWPFNTAYAAARSGGKLTGYITRLSNISQLEPLIKAGVPVALSVRYGGSYPVIPNSAVSSVSGHLIVATGFDKNGNVVVNDPAAGNDGGVRRVYDRAALQRAWQTSDGTTYVIHPTDMRLPEDPLGAY